MTYVPMLLPGVSDAAHARVLKAVSASSADTRERSRSRIPRIWSTVSLQILAASTSSTLGHHLAADLGGEMPQLQPVDPHLGVTSVPQAVEGHQRVAVVSAANEAVRST